jgi:hypothetical protein
MMMRVYIAVLIATIAVLTGCQHRGTSSNLSGVTLADASASPDAAIRTAIRAHVAHNPNLNPNAFDTEVKRVTLDGDHAQAEVEFHVKNGSGVMQLTYALAKQNGAWAVIESTPIGSNFSHPQVNQAQANGPNAATSRDSSIFRTMDSFHGAAAPTEKLPPGHPPVDLNPKGTPKQAP